MFIVKLKFLKLKKHARGKSTPVVQSNAEHLHSRVDVAEQRILHQIRELFNYKRVLEVNSVSVVGLVLQLKHAIWTRN